MTPTYISGFISFWITSVNVRSLKSCQAHNRHSISRNHCNYPSSSPCPTYPLYSTLLWSEKCPSGSPSPRAFLYITLYSFQASPSTWVFLLSISSRVILPPPTATLIPLGRCWSPLPWTTALQHHLLCNMCPEREPCSASSHNPSHWNSPHNIKLGWICN